MERILPRVWRVRSLRRVAGAAEADLGWGAGRHVLMA
jgi:hypothetical protein